MTGIHLDVRAINHIWQRIMRLSPSDRHYLVLKLNEYQGDLEAKSQDRYAESQD